MNRIETRARTRARNAPPAAAPRFASIRADTGNAANKRQANCGKRGGGGRKPESLRRGRTQFPVIEAAANWARSRQAGQHPLLTSPIFHHFLERVNRAASQVNRDGNSI